MATRRSLVDRLADWDDQRRWQEFFDTYWKLIYSAARKSGLTDAEAQEVVQETVITVAKNIDKLKYDPAIGSFKGWLLQITRWRIADQFRKREPGNAKRPRSSDDRADGNDRACPRFTDRRSRCGVGSGVEREFIRSSDRAREKENRAETVSNFRLLRAQRMAGTKSCRAIGSQCRPGVSGATSRRRVIEEGN